ncbi:craniofacial development protein 2-like [Penaeus indicus]|uniref:craniofacial development protein 2-like n=1 Tax=Penaeus indicus TaxID=29960 RepID=UPI00300DACBA
MPPGSGPQTHRPNSVDMRGLPHQERVRPKKLVQNLRIGTLNVGTMTGRYRDMVNLMIERRVDVLCVQETRWTRNKAKELGEGFKLIYGGADDDKRNGIGIILSRDLKDLVTEVNRRNDRIMWVWLVLEIFSVNIFNVYAPQTGCTEEEKAQFWTALQEEMEKVDESERCMVGGDMNGHIGSGYDAFSRIHGGNVSHDGNGDGNEDVEKITDFALSLNMVIGNTLFRRRNEHLITYLSGERASQIDFLLYRSRNIKEIKNCKAIPGDHVTLQHRLVAIDLAIPVTRRQKRKVTTEKRIKWFKLKDHDLKQQFKDRVLRDIDLEIEDVNEWWNRVSANIIGTRKEVLGETSGKI